MKRYFSKDNFRDAAMLGGIMTLLSASRILIDSGLPSYYLLSTFFWLILLSAAVTAWGSCTGMRGWLPSVRELLTGLGWAFLLVLILFPAKVFWFNPLLYNAVEATGNYKALGLIFPATLGSGVALTLWVMSFEALFFQAAMMSFFAKLTKSFYAALFFTTLFRAFVTLLKLQEMGVETNEVIILLHAVIINITSCLLFARYGLPAAMLFIGGISVYRWGIFVG